MNEKDLPEVALDFVKNHVANQYIYRQIQIALEKANNVIETAIGVYYGAGNSEWGGTFGGGTANVQCELTGKTTGRIIIWCADNKDWDKPDLVLTNEDVFQLVRDGALDYQPLLF